MTRDIVNDASCLIDLRKLARRSTSCLNPLAPEHKVIQATLRAHFTLYFTNGTPCSMILQRATA